MLRLRDETHSPEERMQKKNPAQDNLITEAQQRLEEERQKLVVHKVRLPNGATFTRLKPATSS